MFGEARQHLAREHLDRFADVLVPVVAGLGDEDHGIDAGALVALDQVRDLRRRAHRAAQRSDPVLQQLHAQRRVFGAHDLARKAVIVAVALEFLPQVGAPRADGVPKT